MTKARDLANSVNSESIPATRLQNNSIGASKLAPDSVDSSELATDAISTNKVQDNAITPAKLSAGGPSWDSGTVSAAAGVATTLFSLPAANATYLITAMLSSSGDAPNYFSVSLVGTIAPSSRVITAIRTGTLLSISLSGANVQATQSSGITATISWSFTRIANF